MVPTKNVEPNRPIFDQTNGQSVPQSEEDDEYDDEDDYDDEDESNNSPTIDQTQGGNFAVRLDQNNTRRNQ
jgi:hypothetical protein